LVNVHAYTINVAANTTSTSKTYSPPRGQKGKIKRITYIADTSTFNEVTFYLKLGAEQVFPRENKLVAMNLPLSLDCDIDVASGEYVEAVVTNTNTTTARNLHLVFEVEE
jgi:hypothetical protein